MVARAQSTGQPRFALRRFKKSSSEIINRSLWIQKAIFRGFIFATEAPTQLHSPPNADARAGPPRGRGPVPLARVLSVAGSRTGLCSARHRRRRRPSRTRFFLFAASAPRRPTAGRARAHIGVDARAPRCRRRRGDFLPWTRLWMAAGARAWPCGARFGAPLFCSPRPGRVASRAVFFFVWPLRAVFFFDLLKAPADRRNPAGRAVHVPRAARLVAHHVAWCDFLHFFFLCPIFFFDGGGGGALACFSSIPLTPRSTAPRCCAAAKLGRGQNPRPQDVGCVDAAGAPLEGLRAEERGKNGTKPF